MQHTNGQKENMGPVLRSVHPVLKQLSSVASHSPGQEAVGPQGFGSVILLF